MKPIHEHSAGIIPFKLVSKSQVEYLLIHSARVHNPKAKWEFPKGKIERGETPRQAAAREFVEETGIIDWSFILDFEQIINYTFFRNTNKILKTVTYFAANVFDDTTMVRSHEHSRDPSGQWYAWCSPMQVDQRLWHTPMRKLFADANGSLQGMLVQAIAPFRLSHGGPFQTPLNNG